MTTERHQKRRLVNSFQRILPRIRPWIRPISWLAVLAAGLAACGGCRSTGATTGADHAGTVGPVAPVAIDLSAANPTVRLYLLTDLAGALEPCGCTKDQLGGMNHFGAWVKKTAPQATASLVAAAGPLFFMDDKLEPDRAGQDRLKADAIARVLHGLPFAAFAPGENDWNDGPAGLAKLTEDSGGARVQADGTSLVVDAGGVRVGFVGFGQGPDVAGADGRSPAPPEPGRSVVEDVVKKGVVEAEKQGAEVLVALAAVGRGEAKRIADAVPELTAVVVGSSKSNGEGNTTAPPAEQVGNVLVVQAANHLQSVCVLDLYVREPLSPGKVVKFADATGLELARRRDDLSRRIDDLHVRIAGWVRDPNIAPTDVDARRKELAGLEAERDSLDAKPPPTKGSFFRFVVKEMRDSLGTDPSIDASLATYYKAVDEHNRIAFADRVPPPAASGQASYIGIDACTECHAGPRAIWQKTSHARAYETLASQYKEYNLECVSCHVTGYGMPGGSTVTHAAKLENVQCEVCHGPGSKHAASPKGKGLVVASPPLDTCLACHHPPHVEGFDPAVKLVEILGPGHGMR